MIRSLILWLLVLPCAAQIPGTFRVTGPVAPPATNSPFGAYLPRYGTGGLVTGGTLTEYQNTNWYPLQRRHPGQIFIALDGTTYQLNTNKITFNEQPYLTESNATAINLTMLGTSVAADIIITGNLDGTTATAEFQEFRINGDQAAAYITYPTTPATLATAVALAPGQVNAVGDLYDVPNFSTLPRRMTVFTGPGTGDWEVCPSVADWPTNYNILARNTGVGRTVFMGTSLRSVPTLATLLSTPPVLLADYMVGTNTATMSFSITVDGYGALGDGGGGTFIWSPASALSTNTWSVFAGFDSATGRFLRVSSLYPTFTLVAGTANVTNSAWTAATGVNPVRVSPLGTPGAVFMSAAPSDTVRTFTSTSGSDTSTFLAVPY